MISQTLLLAVGDFERPLNGAAVAAALARGVSAGGRPDPEICLVGAAPAGTGESGPVAHAAFLGAIDFDSRMRAARAVVLAVARLRPEELRGSIAFEIATRARQAGVPLYGVSCENRLDSFDARILDLQVILQAGTSRAFTAAGRKLAELA